MMNPMNAKGVYMYRLPIDFRKSICGLTEFISGEMSLNPMDNFLFIFSNKGRDRIKIIYWDKDGFAMWYKILDKKKYIWPKDLVEKTIFMNKEELNDLLDGKNYLKKSSKSNRIYPEAA